MRWVGGSRPRGGTVKQPGGGAAPALHVARSTAPPTLHRIAALANVVVRGEATKASFGRDVKVRRGGGFK